MARESAGLLPFRRDGGAVEVLIGHMGGPMWAKREDRAWTVIKGEIEPGEDAFATARREFREETGAPPPSGPFLDLGEVRQSGGKRVRAWAVEADFDAAALSSSTFELEWPPRSGRRAEFPEIDRFAWCAPEIARDLLVAAQAVFPERLLEALGPSV